MDKKKNSLFWTVCDVLFVLVLCFVMLIAITVITSAVTANAQPFTGYVISWPLLIAVVAALGIYLLYMVRTSLSTLRDFYETANKTSDKEDDHE